MSSYFKKKIFGHLLQVAKKNHDFNNSSIHDH